MTDKRRDFVVKYFFVRGAQEATDDVFEQLDSFASRYIAKDTADFFSYGNYQLYFFKESDEINSACRYRGDDDNLDSHINSELLFVYQWSDSKFSGCEYLRNGKVIKTIPRKVL